ncbi:hypothetical protein MCOR19_006089 [Pyricularia oryzae]|nr:hypothetical protein MCOR01_007720 [Pyricularia oryzae]KAI6257476.1 hypothetical protein MCOR19_006089 [Pyricularia oryzae]KAI6402705.1 hypothetical protein MCOR20_007595 [Pyricularia oryzae]KAI6414169.1 hypothetical protein MCOR24_006410 [Pyricularia oryzae]KAI6462128.1 hypothetical protein MCOR18_010982 [Pyricularia oryzae]
MLIDCASRSKQRTRQLELCSFTLLNQLIFFFFFGNYVGHSRLPLNNMLLFRALLFLLPAVCLAEKATSTEEVPPSRVLAASAERCSNSGAPNVPDCSICIHGCEPSFKCCKIPPPPPTV